MCCSTAVLGFDGPRAAAAVGFVVNSCPGVDGSGGRTQPLNYERSHRVLVIVVMRSRTLSSALNAVAAFLVALLLFWSAPASADVARAPADTPALHGQVTLPEVPTGYEVKQVGWLHLAYPPELSHWEDELIEEANEFKQAASERLGREVLNEVFVRLASTPREMTQLAPPNAPYPPYAAGVAYSRLGLILLTNEPLHPGDGHDLRTTFRHELAHVALSNALEGHRVPLWFNEGLAIHLSGENTFARTRALATASLAEELLPLAELDRRFPNDIVGVPLAYAQSADIVRYLLRSQDRERFRLLISRLRRGQGFDRALHDAYGMDVYNLERAWLEDVEGRFSFWPVLFSGTVLWTIAVVLVTLAWRRKRAKHKRTMARWAREEALDDARAQRALLALDEPSAAPPMWVVARPPDPRSPPAKAGRDSLVPKVEHDGNWHTLH